MMKPIDRLALAFNALIGRMDAAQLHNSSDKESQKEESLARLSDWISGVAYDINEKAADCILHQSKGQSYSNATGINIEDFSRNDLEALKPALRDLHKVCQEEEIAIFMEGFDLLPRPAYTDLFNNGGGYNLSTEDNLLGHLPALHIFIDTTKLYNYAVNPYDDEQVTKFRSTHFKPKSEPSAR